MQEMNIRADQALHARLVTCRSLFLSADAGTGGAYLVRMPDGDKVQIGLKPGEGLAAGGMALAFALLGEERRDAAEAVAFLAGTEENRAIARLCRLSQMMLGNSADFQPASLFAALRTALALLPEGNGEADIPGVIRQSAGETKTGAATELHARTAWAENAAIAYFSLPEGTKEAVIGDRHYGREDCLRGICLPPGATQVPVMLDGTPGILRVDNPLLRVKFVAGFLLGRFFIPAGRVWRIFWKHLSPCLRVEGEQGKSIPALQIVTHAGQVSHREFSLESGSRILSCPRLDPSEDDYVEIRGCGVRYVTIR